MSMIPADYSTLTSVCLPYILVPISILHLYRLANCLILLLTVVQEGWCDSVGSVQEIQAKLLKRQEAAAKRERAMAYALAHQVKHDKALSTLRSGIMFFFFIHIGQKEGKEETLSHCKHSTKGET